MSKLDDLIEFMDDEWAKTVRPANDLPGDARADLAQLRLRAETAEAQRDGLKTDNAELLEALEQAEQVIQIAGMIALNKRNFVKGDYDGQAEAIIDELDKALKALYKAKHK